MKPIPRLPVIGCVLLALFAGCSAKTMPHDSTPEFLTVSTDAGPGATVGVHRFDAQVEWWERAGVPEGARLIWTHIDAPGPLVERKAGWSTDFTFRHWGTDLVRAELFDPAGKLLKATTEAVHVDQPLFGQAPCGPPASPNGCQPLSFMVQPTPMTLMFQGTLDGPAGDVAFTGQAKLEVRDADGKTVDLTALPKSPQPNAYMFQTQGHALAGNWTVRWVYDHADGMTAHYVLTPVPPAVPPIPPTFSAPPLNLTDFPRLPKQAFFLVPEVQPARLHRHLDGAIQRIGFEFRFWCNDPGALRGKQASVQVEALDASGKSAGVVPTTWKASNTQCEGSGTVPQSIIDKPGAYKLKATLTVVGQEPLESVAGWPVNSWAEWSGSCTNGSCAVAKLEVGPDIGRFQGDCSFAPGFKAAIGIVRLMDAQPKTVETQILQVAPNPQEWEFWGLPSAGLTYGAWTLDWQDAEPQQGSYTCLTVLTY